MEFDEVDRFDRLHIITGCAEFDEVDRCDVRCSDRYGRLVVVSDNTCQTASRGLARSLKPVFTRGEVLATVDSLMGLAVGLRCGGNV